MDNRIWYCIKGFNGYEYSNFREVRSMKNFKKYPYGKILKPKSDSNGIYYMLSDNHNDKTKIYQNEIENIIINDDNLRTRRTEQTDTGSRNKLVPTKRQKSKETYITPHFGTMSLSRNPLVFYDDDNV